MSVQVKLHRPLEYYSERLAALTPGFAGADIANVCNEAALIAARNARPDVDMREFEAAVDRVIGGLEKKNKVISKEERKRVAYHESGHAVVSWFLKYAEPLMKVSIVPRGSAALGFAQYLPNEDLLATSEQLQDLRCVALGGRASEEILLGNISTGAQNDLEKVTKMAYAEVGLYGMNGKVGLVSFPSDDNSFSKPYSENTAKLIDEEVRKLIDVAYNKTKEIVVGKKDLIINMAEELLSKEVCCNLCSLQHFAFLFQVLTLEDIERVLGPRPYKTQELKNVDRFRSGFDSSIKLPAEPDKEQEIEESGQESNSEEKNEASSAGTPRIVAS